MCHDERESGQLSWEAFDSSSSAKGREVRWVYVVDNITHVSTPSADRLRPTILAGLQK